MRCSVRGFAVAALAIAGPLEAQKIPAPFPDSARVVYDDDGLRIHSVDGRKQLRVRAYLAVDSRLVLSDTSDASTNGFTLKRARLTIDANVLPAVAFRIGLDMLNVGPAPIVDAFADITLNKHWWIRAGKHKTIYGLERYSAIGDQFFPERSIAVVLTASRDPGLMITGEYGDGKYEGSFGVFDGVVDNGIQESDPNDAKDLELRLIWRPVQREHGQGFQIGFNGTTGVQRGTTTTPQLPRFPTPAGPIWFAYRESAGTIADGVRSRAGVFTAAHFGRWGGTAEWFNNIARLRRSALLGDVGTDGVLAVADYVLSGEPSAHNGIAPAKPFDPSKGQWGAWQAVARVSHVNVAHAAFPVFADSTVSARSATETALGLNWYFTRTTKAMLDWEHTSFVGGALTGNRKPEDYLFLRAQVSF